MAIKVLSNLETKQITAPFPVGSGNVVTDDYLNSCLTLIVADDYESDHTGGYVINDIVFHEGLLFKCTHTTSGDFNSSHWQSIKAVDSTTGKIDTTLLPVSVAGGSDNTTSSDQNKIPLLDSTGKLSLKHVLTSYGTFSVTETFTANNATISNAWVQTTLQVPEPTAANHAASKQYVDDGLFGAGKLLKLKRQLFTSNATYTASNPYVLSLPSGHIGWHFAFSSSGNTYTYHFKLPSVVDVSGYESSYVSSTTTYEIIAVLRKASSSGGNGKIKMNFIYDTYKKDGSYQKMYDENNQLLFVSANVDWIGDDPGSGDGLERGYAYMIVLRSFAFGTSGKDYIPKWVGNIQAKIPIPTEDSY